MQELAWLDGGQVERQLSLSPTVDDPDLAQDDCRNNNFEFGAEDAVSPAKPIKLPGKVCENVSPPAHDPLGMSCPFAGHIRKSYPRERTNLKLSQALMRARRKHIGCFDAGFLMVLNRPQLSALPWMTAWTGDCFSWLIKHRS